jgi:hypothetical protein
MIKLFATLSAFFISSNLLAQDVRLNDSVIFINNKPVALFAKFPSPIESQYDMEVYSFDDFVLIKAELIKFAAPVAELRSFNYYELTFPPTADTFAVYIEEEALPVVMAKIIRNYDLINKNELNKKNVTRFINQYPGGPALTAKIKSFEDYLNETRHFNEQVIRDRTKPVSIINDRIIMQDGVKIGLIVENKDFIVSNRPTSIAVDKSSNGNTTRHVTDQVIYTETETIIQMANERLVDNSKYHSGRWNSEKSNEKNLYKISKAALKKTDRYSDQLLMWVCSLIEDYDL